MHITSKLKRWLKLWLNQFGIKNMKNNKCEDSDTVMIIKLDAIGDFIIWLDSAKEYRGLYPGKKLTLLCNAHCKAIAKAAGFFDEIITLDINMYELNKEYRSRQNSVLKNQNYGLLIQTAYSRTQHMDLLAANIWANKKIAFEADESKSNISRSLLSKKNKERLDGIYDQLIHTSKENLMELQRNKEFIIGLGNANYRSAIPKLPHIDGVKIPEQPYFVVFPGASTQIKMWSPEKYSAVINQLQEIREWNCIICGSQDESYLFDVIASRVKKNRIKNYCGKTSITELIEIVRHSEIVVSNDTSGIHYAAGTGVNGICPYGEYNYGRFLPYQSDEGTGSVFVCSAGMKCRNCSKHHMSLTCIGNIIRRGRYYCLEKVEPEAIMMRIKTMI